VKVYGLIEDLEVYLHDFPHINLNMIIVVIGVSNAWGMLLSRSWAATLIGFLNMDLTHAHIPMGDGTFEILYSWQVVKKHVMDPNHPDYHSDCEFDVPQQVIEYYPWEFPFEQEYCIDRLIPRTNEYKENLLEFQGKEPRSIKILKKEEDKKDKEREQYIKDMVKETPPSKPCIENIPYINFSEGIFALMWDKNKGNPKYDKGNEVVWLGLYLVKNKYQKGTYYLSTMDGRRIPLSVDGSLILPYFKGT